MGRERERRDRSRFHTTRWSMVLAAGNSAHPDFRPSLESLCEIYWYPLYAYIRRRGCDADTAQDLAQGFFSNLLERGSLRIADPDRGRFRSFLLTSLKNYMTNEWDRERAQKRGGGREPIPLDLDTAEGRYQREPADDRAPDRYFARRWALALLDRTMERLRQEMGRSGGPERFERLSPFLTGDDAGTPYKRVAAELDMSESAVKVAIHRMRKRYGQLLREEVAQTVDDPSRVDEEIRYLFGALAP